MATPASSQATSPQPPFVSALLSALLSFDFQHATPVTARALTDLIVSSSHHDPRIPLGTSAQTQYSLEPEPLGPNSLNSADIRPEGSVHELLKDLSLKFKPGNIETPAAQDRDPTRRRAFALGRLHVSPTNAAIRQQSHWVLFLDESKNIWALRAKAIDIADRHARAQGRPESPAYDIALDTAFGVDTATATETAVCLGPITELPFGQHGTPLRNPPQAFTLQCPWSTTFARFPGHGKPTIALAHLRRLLAVDTGILAVPSYSWRSKSKSKSKRGHIIDISDLGHEPGYLRFCHELGELNGSGKGGLVVGRALAEAAWCDVLLQRMAALYEYAEDRQRLIMVLISNLEALSACLLQMDDMLMRRYWLGQKAAYPHLDTTSLLPDDPKVDDPSELATWILGVLQQKTKLTRKARAKAKAKARKTATQKSKQMDLDLDTGEAHDTWTNPLVLEPLEKRLERAELAGLVCVVGRSEEMDVKK